MLQSLCEFIQSNETDKFNMTLIEEKIPARFVPAFSLLLHTSVSQCHYHNTTSLGKINH